MTVSVFLLTLGIGLILAALQPLIQGTFRKPLLYIVLGLGALLILFGAGWNLMPTPEPGGLRDAVQRAANSFGWWFAIVASVWVYQTSMNLLTEVRRNNEIIALRNDVQAIAKVIERVVMPRHLTERQQHMVTVFLKLYDPFNVTFRVIAHDSEAEGFRSDLEKAFRKAGWTINPSERSDDVQEGLRVHMLRAPQDDQRANAAQNQDGPEKVVQMAFGLARVGMDGSSSGGGQNVKETKLVISIGRNRKDSFAIELPAGFV